MEIFLGAFTADWERRKAALLHDLSLGRSPFEEDERRRRGGSVAPGVAGWARRSGDRSFLFSSVSERVAGRRESRPADRPMRVRYAGLATGSQPAVVKLASFGGGARLGTIINYVSRNGEIVVENERGDQLRGRDQLTDVGSEWGHLMKNRATSRDIGLFTASIVHVARPDADLFEQGREIVKHALGDRAFAFAITEHADGRSSEIHGVAVLRDRKGDRLTGDDRAASIVQRRLETALGAAHDIRFQFTGYGNGTDYGTSRLRQLVENHPGGVQDEQGRSVIDAKRAGELVQLEWRSQLHSRKPRDVMHLVISARAGTDTAAFVDAARDFLASQFAGHRYVFSMHDASSDPKAEVSGGKRPHVHVHSIVAMNSDAGDRIETTISAFRQWRLTIAEKARTHGIKMEMTDRRDRASPPSYGKNQVRPLNTIGRTIHQGTSQSADARYRSKRADVVAQATTARSQAYLQTAVMEWSSLSNYKAVDEHTDFIKAQIARIDDRGFVVGKLGQSDRHAANSVSRFRTQLVKLFELVSESEDMRHMTRPEFEAYEKRVETALAHAERVLPSDARKDFDAIAEAAREHVNVQRQLVELTTQRDVGDHPQRQLQTPAGNARENERSWQGDPIGHGGPHDAAGRAHLDIGLSRKAPHHSGVASTNYDQRRVSKREPSLAVSHNARAGAMGDTTKQARADLNDEQKRSQQVVKRDREINRPEFRVARETTDGVEERHTASNASIDPKRLKGQGRAIESEIGGRPRIRGNDATQGHLTKQPVTRQEELQRDADKLNQNDRDNRER